MRSAVQSAQRFVAAPIWKDYVIGPASGLQNATTDDQLDQYIREFSVSAAHAVGTAGMSAMDADYGVVNPDLHVKGALSLRIVDASVMVCSFVSLSSVQT